MKYRVIYHFFTGCPRFLCALLLAGLVLPPEGFAATLQWAALPDRERITITSTPSEGMPGPAKRVSAQSVIIPYDEVPSNLLVPETPKGAKIFKGTRQLGQTLVFSTQTPSFGFVVSRQTSGTLIIDFFPDALGARWKPDGEASAAAKEASLPPAPPPSSIPPASNATATPASAQVAPNPAEQPPLSSEPKSPATAQENPATAPPVKPEPPHVVPLTPLAPVHIPGRQPSAPPVPVIVTPDGTPVTAPVTTARAEEPGMTAVRQWSSPVPVPEPSQTPSGDTAPPSRPENTAANSSGKPEAKAVPPVPEQASEQARISAGQDADGTPAADGQTAPAPAASPAVPAGVGIRQGGVYRGAFNPGGIENTVVPVTDKGDAGAESTPSSPAEKTFAPQSAVPPDPKGETQTVRPAGAATGNATQKNSTIQYVDEQGNPVTFLDPAATLNEIHDRMGAGDYVAALEKTDALLTQADIPPPAPTALTPAQREELLHTRSEMLFALHKDSFEQAYQQITDASNQAIAFNPQSPRNAGDLLRLGYMNLKLKNIPEAEARFNMLRRMYPHDETVPLTYYYWGDYYYGRNELQKAAEAFQSVLQNFPDSRYARESALGLARSFHRLGYYEQAFNLVDYIERRWPRFYLEYPPFLNMMGDVAFRLNRLDYALNHYWLYTNLEPKGNEADIILTRIADIYSLQNEKGAAKEVYKQSASRFPDKDGGLVARMRLAEESINDDPSISGMLSVFQEASGSQPEEVYKDIVAKHPTSALAPLAELKLAMWHLWNHQYLEALDTCTSFTDKYPKNELAPKVKEIALKTFAALATQTLAEGGYGQMRAVWEKYPIVHGQDEMLTPESRVALGVSFWKAGQPDEALTAVTPFFLGGKVPRYSEMALDLALNIYLEYDQWTSIRELAHRVELWELEPGSRRSLDYALALAAENLGESDIAAPLWEKLYTSPSLPPAQMAYATYFLAKDAERNRDLEKAYLMGSEALRRLLQLVEKTPSEADTGKIKSQIASLIDITETAGRLRESLAFAQQYLQYTPQGDADRVGILYRMARIHRKQGDTEAWKKGLEEIARDYPGTVYGQTAASELNSAAITDDAAKYSPTGKI